MEVGNGAEVGKPVDLRTGMQEAFDPTFSTLGHGTRREVAKASLAEGLQTKQPDLLSTTVPLFDASKSFDEQAEGVVDHVTHWPHLDSRAVVVVMIPNPAQGEPGGRTYFNSVFEELPEEDRSENAQYRIPPEYIRGYVDADSGVFV